MLADDVTAVVFERCWIGIATFRPRNQTVRPWLFRVAANELASHYRREGRRGAREHLAAVRDRPLTDQADVGDGCSDEVELLDAMSRLRPRDQTVLSLRFLADLTTQEAAEALGVDRSHLAVLQHRALTMLRRELGGVGDG